MKIALTVFSLLLAAWANAATVPIAVEIKLTGLLDVANIKPAILDVTETNSRQSPRVTTTILAEGQRSGSIEVLSINPRDGNVLVRNAGVQTLLSLSASPTLAPVTSATGIARFEELPLESLLELLGRANQRMLLHASSLPGVKFTGQRGGLDNLALTIWIEELLESHNLVLTPSGNKFMFLTAKGEPIPAPLNETNPAPSKTAYEPTSLRFNNMPVEQFLEFYGDVTGRSVLRPMLLPGVTITLSSRQEMSKTELVYALDRVLELNGLRVTPRGDKFVIVTESSAPIPSIQLSVPAGIQSQTAQTTHKPGAINLQAMSLAHFLEFYQAVTGRRLDVPKILPGNSISFRSKTDLSQAELTEAFDTLLALNGIQVTNGAAGLWQVSPLARAAKP